MYKSVRIQNFRGFEDLTVDGLTRVNLIVGDNSVGKTALLEAVMCLNRAATGDILPRLDLWRGLFVSTASVRGFLESLFNDFNTHQEIVLRADEESQLVHQVSLTVDSDEMVFVPATDGRPRHEGALIVKVSDTDQEPYEGKITLTPPIRDDETEMRMRMPLDVPRRPAVMLSIQAVGGASEDAYRLASLKENRQEDKVVLALKLLEPRLTDLDPLPKGNSYWIYANVGGPRLVPLGLLGSGLVRLLSMVVAGQEAQKGALCIDEIDAGLHHTVHANVWRALGQASHDFDYQLFATTHSYECMTAAYEAFTDHPEDFSMHRLERVNDQIVCKSFGHEHLGTALELGFEVR